MASETVILGQTGITTSSLDLGCVRLGSVLTPTGPGESLALLQRGRAIGVSCESAEEVAASIRIEGVSIVQPPLPAEQGRLEAFALAAQRGKAILLRLSPPPARAESPEGRRTFQQRFCTMLGLRGVAGVIVGTTQPGHLEQNVAAWHSALKQSTA
jgi:aryl-alcohol dehydrogenase-like predicted oxidoreductase